MPPRDMPEVINYLPPFVQKFMAEKSTPIAEADPTLGVEDQEPDSAELAEIMAAAGKGFDL